MNETCKTFTSHLPNEYKVNAEGYYCVRMRELEAYAVYYQLGLSRPFEWAVNVGGGVTFNGGCPSRKDKSLTNKNLKSDIFSHIRKLLNRVC